MITLEELSRLKKKVNRLQDDIEATREYLCDPACCASRIELRDNLRGYIEKWRKAVIEYNKAERSFLESL